MNEKIDILVLFKNLSMQMYLIKFEIYVKY